MVDGISPVLLYGVGEYFYRLIKRATNFLGKTGWATNFWGKTGRATNTIKIRRATHISGPSLYTIPCNHKERFELPGDLILYIFR